MDDLRCNGTEDELINCAQSPFSQNNCNHHEDAGVQCSGTLSIGKFRIRFLDILFYVFV